MPRPLSRLVIAASLLVLAAACAFGQTQPLPALAPLDESRLVRLTGTVHPLARPENDRGPVPDSFPANRMLVVLNPPADRQQALATFLRDAHDPASPNYHRWLTPEEFGANFGARDENLQPIQAWLQSQGFTITRLAKNRRFLEFSGTAAQVRQALHTEIHQYAVAGKTYYSIANDVAIPQAIAPLLKGFAPLNNFPLHSYARTAGKATYSPQAGRAKPQFTTTSNGAPFYAVSPEDFATQYDITPLYQAGTDGSGQTIGIIGESNLDLTATAAFRKLFGLSGDNTQVVIDGQDPGDGGIASVGIILSENVEGYLDAEIAGAVAPKAVVNFYIAGGTPFQSTLILAAMRAVEDNQAAILSVSYGECEQLLGPNRDLLWATLWEQAAAQGQTVLVTSGDQGPSSCGAAISVNGQITYLGLSVNGIASTPWDVAVGGTDFFYSDYAAGGASSANAWNTANDSDLGSLKAPLPEQPWDDELGLNIPPASTLIGGIGVSTSFLLGSGEATGGGPSSCSQFSTLPGQTAYPYVCVGGYPKPSWQSAPGVPADGVRDLPDVSLFAGDGRNLSAYAICAEPSDCAAVSSGEPQVTLAGGTSAAAPAMAGIMALVNQKFGRQGQANFVLYALANQQPGVFHDVTVGTNDVFCLQPVPACPAPPPLSLGFPSYGVYAAAPGYDLASGLGSLDVNALISNWNKIIFQPTSTTLQLTPASIVHGAGVNITASVKANSGTATPTGDVSLTTNAPTPQLKSPAITLASGTATTNWNFFPGGTYQVTARYAGDGTFATSTSAPSTLTVTPEPSTTALNLEYEFENSAATLPLVHLGTITNGGQAPFGSIWNFTAQPSGQTSQSTGDATGSATFTDGSTSATVPLNAQGVANWSPQTLALGAHSFAVSYSGDASYNPSTAGPLSFTVTSGGVRLLASLQAIGFVVPGPPQVITYQANSPALVRVSLAALRSFVPPTGTVTVNFGSLTQIVPVTSAILPNETVSEVTATFANVPAGTYVLSASYSGDSNWGAATFTAPQTYTFANSTASPTTTTLSLTPSSVDGSGIVKFTATVTASQPPPLGGFGLGGAVTLFANGYAFASVSVLAPFASPSTATGAASIPATAIPSGPVQITAVFQGNSSFMPSTSAPVPLTVTLSDFTLSPGATSVIVKSGSSASIPLLLGGPNGGSASVSLNCLPSANFYCSLSPSSPTVKGATTATLTINAYINQIIAATTPDRSPVQRAPLATSASFVFACALLAALPRRRSLRALQLCFALLAAGAFVAGCGAGGSSVINPPPPPQKLNTPPGNYSVVVTATSGAINHNTKVAVVVQ